MNHSTTLRCVHDDADGVESLGSRLVNQLAEQWRRGHRLSADDLLAAQGELAERAEIAVRLIYEEICQREDAGEAVRPEEVLARYPQWRSELAALLDCHQLLSVAPARPQFPQVGQRLGDFQLVEELDRGAAGRVFLATQPSLSDRPVALKLTAARGHEHLSLARLQHAYIVPLHLMQDYPERNLRALCMPYLGGRSLARLLEALADVPLADRAGRHVAEILRAGSAMHAASPGSGPAARFFARASYVQTICWIGACLAEALDYAHERGLLHLDVKPANVLVAADGQPMLLDFHLAREPVRPHAAPLAWMGGTAGYMAPEQCVAMAAVRSGTPPELAVDARADIYSLGMLLYESLGGSIDVPRNETSGLKAGAVSRPLLKLLNPLVSAGLQDIVHKCLAHDPADRYASAAALAEDLRRHLAHLPLKQVANRSLAERWRKWRIRRPQSLTRMALLLSLLAVAATLGGSYLGNRRHEAHRALIAGRQHYQSGQYDLAGQAFQQGLHALDGLPWSAAPAAELRTDWALARRAAVAHNLGRLVDRLRLLDANAALASTRSTDLAAGCRNLWESRHKLLAADDGRLAPDAELRIEADLADLAIFWAELLVQRAAADEQHAARHAALATLAEAEELFGVGPALWHQRRQLVDAFGEHDTSSSTRHSAAELTPRSGREHDSLGRFLLRAGQLEQAAEQFQRAIDHEPQAFWPHFYLGTCAYRRGEHHEALQAFAVCIALDPQRAECFYNRALAYTALGNAERALRDYNRALELDSTLAVAALNRAVLHCRAQRYEQAEADLRWALAQGADPAKVHYTWGLLHLAQNQHTAALGSVRTALAHAPQHPEARALLARLESHP